VWTKVEGRVAQGHALDTGSEVDDVAFLAAGGVEAGKDVVAEVDAEGAAAGVAAVDGTRPAALRAAAA
jgi:hypothetical protein